MFKDDDTLVIVFSVGALLVLAVLGGLFFMSSKPTTVTTMAAPSPAPVASTVSVTSSPQGPVVRIVADPEDPESPSELRFGDKTYTPDEAGFADLLKDLEAASDGNGVTLIGDSTLSAEAVQAVMGAFIRSELEGGISLKSEPDQNKAEGWLDWKPEE